MTDKEIMQMALDAMENGCVYGGKQQVAIQTLRDRLEQPEAEPVAWMCEANSFDVWKPTLTWTKTDHACFRDWQPLYTAPPKREWVGLTEKEIFEHEWWDEETAFHVNKYLTEKNHGMD